MSETIPPYDGDMPKPENEISLADCIRTFSAHAKAGHMVPGSYATFLKEALDQAIECGGYTTGVEPIKPWLSRLAVYGGSGDDRWFSDTSMQLYKYIEASELLKADGPPEE